MATVPVNDNDPIDQYTATAGQTIFPYTFWIEDQADLAVYVNGTLKTLTTDYTIDVVQNDNGGNVTFLSGLTLNDKVTLTRDTVVDRITGFTTSGGFSSDNLNLELSRVIAMIQERERDILRGLRISEFSEVPTSNLVVPDLTGNGLKIVRINTGATAFEYVDAVEASLTAALTPTLNNFIVGNGSAFVTTTQIDLSTHVKNNLPVTNLNGGTGASATSFWRGDGSWSVPAGGGDVAGPGTSTENTIALYDTANNTIKDGPAIGTSGHVLTSAGAGNPPSFKVLPFDTGFMAGQRVLYASASTLTVPSGFRCRDSADSFNIEIPSDQTVDITASGANGLDTGSEASDTWYYLYVIGDSTGSNTAKGLLSVTNESSSGTITLPNGYDKKRQLPFAVRNDGSSNFIPFDIGSGWPNNNPEFIYDVHHHQWGGTVGPTNILDGGNTSGSTFADADGSNYIPPISQLAKFHCVSGTASNVGGYLRKKGSTHDGLPYTSTNAAHMTSNLEVATNSSQVIEYNRGINSVTTVDINVMSFKVTEVV